MEAVQAGKPRLSYADFLAAKKQQRGMTIAQLIQKVIDDVLANPTTIKPISESWMYTYRRMQRSPLGAVQADKLGRADVITYCKARRSRVKPATVRGDLTALRSALNHASSSFPECEKVGCGAIEDANHFLVKNQIIGKAARRTRLPTADEITLLLDDLAKSDAHPNTKIKMVPVVAFGLVSARRRGEVCRITHGDVDYENKIYWVRDVKHPTAKKGNDKAFTLWPDLERIIKLQPRIDQIDPTERIFPYDPKSVTKRYIDSKKRCKIVGLRLHDNRGEATSKWLLKLGSRDKVRKLVTGHDSEKAFDIYDRRTTLDIMNSDAAIQKFLQPGDQRVST